MQTLRPLTFDDFIGKNVIKDNLKIFIESSKSRNEPLDHVLLHGIAGTGKTTIANIIANSYNKKIKIIQGTQLKKVCDLINFISMVSEGDFIFIDEIHAMNNECMETLYSILEDFTIDIKIGVNNNQKVSRVKLPLFTIIGATTNIDKIPKPLEERFPINLFFDVYNNEEIYSILKRTTKLLNINFTEDELCIIAANCKGIPRLANNYIKRIYDFKLIDKQNNINEILKRLGIYKDGLHKMDIMYLKVLSNYDEFVGVKTIASLLELDQSTIENKIEPYLLKQAYIRKNSRGRCLTKKGIEYVEQESN